MTRTACLVSVLALLLCVRGQYDESHWQDEDQQHRRSEEQHPTQQQEVTTDSGDPPGAYHQSWAEETWMQVEGSATTIDQVETAPMSENQLAQQQQTDVGAVAEGYSQSGEAVAEASQASSTVEGSAAVIDISENHYGLYLKWYKQGEKQPFWEWLVQQPEYQHTVQNQQEHQHSNDEANTPRYHHATPSEPLEVADLGAAVDYLQQVEHYATLTSSGSAESTVGSMTTYIYNSMGYDIEGFTGSDAASESGAGGALLAQCSAPGICVAPGQDAAQPMLISEPQSASQSEQQELHQHRSSGQQPEGQQQPQWVDSQQFPVQRTLAEGDMHLGQQQQQEQQEQQQTTMNVIADLELATIVDPVAIAAHAQQAAAAAASQAAAGTSTLSEQQALSEQQLAGQNIASVMVTEEPTAEILAAGGAVSTAVTEESGGVVSEGIGSGTIAPAASASETDAAAAALTAAAEEEVSRGPSDSKPGAVAPRADGKFEAVSEPDRVAAQAAVEAASRHPLGGMKVLDVQKKVKQAQELIYANITHRNITEGLRKLRELRELVEAAIPPIPTTRARFTPPGTTEDGGNPVAGDPEPQRPLALEVAENRHVGLHAAAAATFHLAALQSSGVVSPELLPRDPMGVIVALHQAARAGSLEALMALAERYTQGIDTPANCPRGVQFGIVAATHLIQELEKEQRYILSPAPVFLRERFSDGRYVVVDDPYNVAAVTQYDEQMAFRGNTEALQRMAYRRLVGRGVDMDPEGAFNDFQAAAARGDPYAIFNIGYMYMRGLFVPQNFTAAKEHFEKAAQKGLPVAHNGLGVMAWNGQGMAQNLTYARECFERGVAANYSDSFYNLGTMHFNGLGVPVNKTQAVDLFMRAVGLGSWRATFMMATVYMAGAGVEANCTRAMQYLRTLFEERGNWGKELAAAVKLLDAGDPRGALLAYISVAEQGSAAAAANAAWLLRHRAGYSGPDADKLAAKYFLRAAKQGHAGSMVELAHMILQAAPETAPPAPEPATDAPAQGNPPDGEAINGEAAELAKKAPSAGASNVAATPSGAAGSDNEVKPLAATVGSEMPTKSENGATASDTAVAGTTAQPGAGSEAPGPGSNTSSGAIAESSTPTNVSGAGADAVATQAGDGGGIADAEVGSVQAGAADPAGDAKTMLSKSKPNANVYLPPLMSSTSAKGLSAPQPPLVPPAALPSKRIVLGVSKLSDAVEWYRSAAATGDPEGLFYLGWAYYYGLGVAENATFAKMLWMRSLDAAGINSARGMAPLLALVCLWIDEQLAPLLGPRALGRLQAKVKQVQDVVQKSVLNHIPLMRGNATSSFQGAIGISAGLGARSAQEGLGDGPMGGLLGSNLGQSVMALGSADLENVVLLGLLMALVLVLVLRRRRHAAQT